jgi:hypothetical protein
MQKRIPLRPPDKCGSICGSRKSQTLLHGAGTGHAQLWTNHKNTLIYCKQFTALKLKMVSLKKVLFVFQKSKPFYSQVQSIML